jgi:hypothetical protein
MKSLTEDGPPICPSFRAGKRRRSCTSLLYEPAETLMQRQRWPDHLCYSEFMERSIDLWVSGAVGKITPAIRLWAECYPLPIGEAAARRLYIEQGQRYPDGLTGYLPFKGAKEAYWALRVEANRSVLDMFGLKGWMPPDATAGDYLWFGGLAYSLRGHDDTSLVRLVPEAAAWWRNISWEKIQGRPRGSGTWESPGHLRREVGSAVRALHEQGDKVTQEAVADLLQTNDRVLRRWLSDNNIDWREVKKQV